MNYSNHKACTGNAKILVLINSQGRLCDIIHIESILFAFLQHCGIPYAILDIAEKEITESELENCAGILLGHDNICACLTENDWDNILKHVSDGIGLISLDSKFKASSVRYAKELGLELERFSVFSNLLHVPPQSHYINKKQNSNALIKIKRFIPISIMKNFNRQWASALDAVIGHEQLIYTRHLLPGVCIEPSHIPAVIYRTYGNGRIVFYNISSRLWLNDFLGHANGLDDVFYSSITWAARKPFVTKSIPKYATLRIDDCSGEYDFKYVEILNRYGIIPTVACFLDRLDENGWQNLRKYHDEGNVSILTHGFSYYNLLYSDFGIGDYEESKLKELFDKADTILGKYGIPHNKIAHGHCNEWGTNVLPYLKARKQTAIELSPHYLGEGKSERTLVPVYPYSSSNLGYDCLPEDNYFFRYYCQFKAGTMSSLDFLEGDVLTWLGQNSYNDIKKAARNGVGQVSKGVDSLYFGQMITHEQKFSMMTLEEIDHLFCEISRDLGKNEVKFMSLEKTVEYLKAHRNSWLKSVEIRGDDVNPRIEAIEPVKDIVLQVHYDDHQKEIRI